MKLIYTAALLVIILAACTKHTGDKTLPDADISISEPLQGSSYGTGDSVTIKGIAISSVTLHGYDIAIKKANDTLTYFSAHIHNHNDTLLVNYKWKNTLSGVGTVDAAITVYLDHDGHTATKKAAFYIR